MKLHGHVLLCIVAIFFKDCEAAIGSAAKVSSVEISQAPSPQTNQESSNSITIPVNAATGPVAVIQPSGTSTQVSSQAIGTNSVVSSSVGSAVQYQQIRINLNGSTSSSQTYTDYIVPAQDIVTLNKAAANGNLLLNVQTSNPTGSALLGAYTWTDSHGNIILKESAALTNLSNQNSPITVDPVFQHVTVAYLLVGNSKENHVIGLLNSPIYIGTPGVITSVQALANVSTFAALRSLIFNQLDYISVEINVSSVSSLNINFGGNVGVVSLPTTLNWTNGFIFVPLAFDVNQNVLIDLTTLPVGTSPAGVEIFFFDGVSHQLLGSYPVNSSQFNGKSQQTPWNINNVGFSISNANSTNGTYPAAIFVNSSENGNYDAFKAQLGASGVTLNEVSAVMKGANSVNNQTNCPGYVTIGGYTFFSNQFNQSQPPSLGVQALSEYLVSSGSNHGVTWNTGVTFVLLEFNALAPTGQIVSNLANASETDILYLFLFDAATGKPLATSGIPVDIHTDHYGQNKLTAANFNFNAINVKSAISATYPTACTLTMSE